MKSRFRTVSTLVFSGLAALSAPAQNQRPVQIISKTTDTHTNAKISPDGRWAAFIGPAGLGVVDTGGLSETTILVSTSITEFVWSHGSSTLFVAEGDKVRSVPRSGGSPITIVRFANQSVWVWDSDSTDSLLFGTHLDPMTKIQAIFSVDSSGGRLPKDLVSGTNLLTDVRVDPTDAFILFKSQGTQPFDPISYWRADIDGQNLINLTPNGVGPFAETGDWLDAGDTALISAADMTGTLEATWIKRGAPNPEPLTSFSAHRRTGVAESRTWTVFEAVDLLGGNPPAVMPPDGGGLIYLETGTGYQYTGAPMLDGSGDRVVFSASRIGTGEKPKIFRIDLDREMRVHPRVELGKTFSLDLPAFASEIGVILLGVRAPAPFLLPGAKYFFYLDPSFLVLKMARGTGAQPISTQLPLPNVPALRGIRIYFQGLRYDPVQKRGEMTRHGVFTIF